jgi:hypothetical protein
MEYLDGIVLQAAGAVVLVQQILKSKLVPLQFANRYPVPTNILLSILAAAFIVKVDWSADNWINVIIQVVTIGVVAAITFNQLFGKWHELRETESKEVEG